MPKGIWLVTHLVVISSCIMCLHSAVNCYYNYFLFKTNNCAVGDDTDADQLTMYSEALWLNDLLQIQNIYPKVIVYGLAMDSQLKLSLVYFRII